MGSLAHVHGGRRAGGGGILARVRIRRDPRTNRLILSSCAGFDKIAVWWTHPTFRNRGTAYNSRSFAGNLLFVGDYGS